MKDWGNSGSFKASSASRFRSESRTDDWEEAEEDLARAMVSVDSAMAMCDSLGLVVLVALGYVGTLSAPRQERQARIQPGTALRCCFWSFRAQTSDQQTLFADGAPENTVKILTAVRLCSPLFAMGFNMVSPQGRRMAVRELTQRNQEVFVPLAHPPGEAQVDFAHALVKLNRVLRKVAFFVMALPYSDAVFVQGPGGTSPSNEPQPRFAPG